MSDRSYFPESTTGKIALGAGASLLAAGLAGGAYALVKRRKKKSKRSSNVRKKRYYYKKKKGQRYTPHTAGKRRDRSSRRIRYTKNGQPYIINKRTGKARFITKKSARMSHNRTGGRY